MTFPGKRLSDGLQVIKQFYSVTSQPDIKAVSIESKWFFERQLPLVFPVHF